MGAIESKVDGVHVHVRVQPRSSRNAITATPDGRIQIALTAPPAEGAANKALCELVAKHLGSPKRNVSLIRGKKSREKTLRVTGLTSQEVTAKLIPGR